MFADEKDEDQPVHPQSDQRHCYSLHVYFSYYIALGANTNISKVYEIEHILNHEERIGRV